MKPPVAPTGLPLPGGSGVSWENGVARRHGLAARHSAAPPRWMKAVVAKIRTIREPPRCAMGSWHDRWPLGEATAR